MSTTTKVPPPLKPKPKIPPKKNINLNTLDISTTTTKIPSKSFEPKDHEPPAEFISSLRGGLRKTNRDLSSFDKNDHDNDPLNDDNGSSTTAPIIKPKLISDTKESKLPPPDVSHLDKSPVRLPGMTRNRSSTNSSVDSISESAATSSTSRFPNSSKYKQLLNKGINKSTETFNKSYAKSSEKLDTLYKKIPKSSDQLDQMVKKIPRRSSKASSFTPEVTDEESTEDDNLSHNQSPIKSKRTSYFEFKDEHDDDNLKERQRSSSTSKQRFENFYKKIPKSSDQLDQLVGSSSEKLGKMVKKIPHKKSRASISTSISTPELSDDESLPNFPSKKPSRPAKPSINITTSITDDEEEDDDTPPLPQRPKTAPHNSNSIISKKPKPIIPLKKSLLTEPSTTPSRSNLTPPAPPKSRSRTTSITANVESISITTESPEPSVRSSVAPPPPKSRSKPQAPPSRSSASSLTTTAISSPIIPSNSSWKESDLDLNLDSQWYISNNDDSSEFPKDLQNLNYFTSFGFMGKKQFKIYAFRLNDLSTIKLKLIWDKDSSNPSLSLEHDLKFIPPPSATKDLLLQGNIKYGEHVANWCETKIGTKVGNGECWTLAHDALEKSCGKHAFVTSGYQHGALLTTLIGVEKKGVAPKINNEAITDEVKRGDILQFKSCGFRYPNKALYFGSPDHTAIVSNVEPSPDNSKFSKLNIIHQNFNGHKIVAKEEIELDKLIEGELKIFRPVDASWIPSLEDSLLSL